MESVCPADVAAGLTDDDDELRLLGLLALRKIGRWRALEAADGEAALAIARAEAPDLIVLDVVMPGMDGPATLAALRADPATAAIPVIFLTAKTGVEETAALRELGALGVIAKPFAPLELPAALRRIVDEA